MKLSASKRLQAIADKLQNEGYVKALDLSELYEVSMETIRKDLTYLEEKGIAKKEYGGASLSLLGVEKKMKFRMNHEENKHMIARYAAKMLQEYHSVIIDSGSTCQACIRYINALPSMDIITNSLDACNLLNGDQHNVFMLPGRKREKNGAMIGNWTEKYLERIHADVCLLGTSGLLNNNGPTSHSYNELTTKQMMIRQSDFVFVLADSSKFFEQGFHLVCDWSEIDGIITDCNISNDIYDAFSKKTNVYICDD